jgi:hypothetical protein
MPSLSPEITISVEDRSLDLDLRIVPVDCKPLHGTFSTRRELVTITVLREDYAKLKAAGGPHPTYIVDALHHYLNVIKETHPYPQTDSPGWRRGPVVTFLCAIPKPLSNEIRGLSGRFDSHTIQAFRLFCL